VAQDLESADTVGATPSEDAPAALPIGARLGDRYVVRAFLGQGGMGAVYRALDEKLDEEVALKLVHAGARLAGEVRLAQKVTHPNVCRTYDLEDVDGRQVLKMEYVAGESLSARLAKAGGPLPVDETLRIARAIAAGLAAAHAKGIVHRDLKPGNVMLATDGRVVLMDFGLAQVVSKPDGAIAGTPGYMAPEQVLGRSVDERADLWALGRVVSDMLGKAPAPRWLARALAALLDDAPAKRPPGLRRLVAGPRRIALPVAVGAALLAGAAVVVWKTRPARVWKPKIVDLAQFEENSDQPVFSPDGKWLAYPSDSEVRDAMRFYVVDANGPGDHPRAITPPGESCIRGTWTRDGALLLSCGLGTSKRQIEHWTLDGQRTIVANGLSATDCGDALAYLRVDESLALRAADGTESMLVTAQNGDAISYPRCSTDGQRIVYGVGPSFLGMNKDIFIVDRAGVVTQVTHEHDAYNATFTPDGRSIIFAAAPAGKVDLFEIPATGGRRRQLTFDDGPDVAPDVSPDGKRLLFDRDITSTPLMRIVAGVSSKVTSRVEVLAEPRPSFDGTFVLAVRHALARPEIVEIDPATGAERTITAGSHPFPSLDDRTIYFQDPDRPTQLSSIARAGGAPARVVELTAPILRGVAAPDGLHFTAGGVSWHLAPGSDSPENERLDGLVVPGPGSLRLEESDDAGRFHIRVLPAGVELTADSSGITWLDEKRFAYIGDNAAHVIDASTGEEVASVPGPQLDTDAILARDGKTIYDTNQTVSHVTRHEIVNFASRPKP
jgi:Tol biopolymer transport system component